MGIGFCNPIFKEAEVDKLYEHDVEIFIPKIHAFCFGDIKISEVPRITETQQQNNSDINPQDMNLPGYRLHKLTGDRKDLWSVTVSGNWRITFYFEGQDAYLVDYEDYH